jgi:acyl dehydratase
MKQFESLDVGDVFEFGGWTVTRDEIVEFAEQYDPQPFHLNEAATEDSLFEGLVASGLQTLCVCNRLATEGAFGQIAIVAGRGIDELRFPRPVHPGDSLRVRVEITDKSLPDPQRDIGEVHIEVTGYNQNDEPVISWTSLTLVAREGTGGSVSETN